MKTRVYVGNLSFEVVGEDLDELFGLFGSVRSEVARKGGGPRSLGFGFVEFDGEAEAGRAIEELHGRELGGRKLRVRLARESGGSAEGED